MEKLIQIQGPNILRQLLLAIIITAAGWLIHNEQLFTHYLSIAGFEVCEKKFFQYLFNIEWGSNYFYEQLLIVTFSENGWVFSSDMPWFKQTYLHLLYIM